MKKEIPKKNEIVELSCCINDSEQEAGDWRASGCISYELLYSITSLSDMAH